LGKAEKMTMTGNLIRFAFVTEKKKRAVESQTGNHVFSQNI
jgi:hypothetical protein